MKTITIIITLIFLSGCNYLVLSPPEMNEYYKNQLLNSDSRNYTAYEK